MPKAKSTPNTGAVGKTRALLTKPKDGLERRIKELVATIATLGEITEEARGAGHYSAAVQATSRIVSLQQDIRRCETTLVIMSEPDDLQKTELLLTQALEDGSMTAASSLTAQLYDRKRTAEAERKAAEEEARQAADPATAMRNLVEALRGLPADQAVAIRESLGWI
jgi:hypothetical protein